MVNHQKLTKPSNQQSSLSVKKKSKKKSKKSKSKNNSQNSNAQNKSKKSKGKSNFNQNKSKKLNVENMDESTKAFLKQLTDFQSSQDTVYTFEAKLDTREWAKVHELCQKLGLVAKSSGRTNERCVSAHKRGHKQKSGVRKSVYMGGDEKQPGISTLDLSLEAKGILMDLFRQYPPREDEAVKQNIGKNHYMSIRRKDDFFCRPKLDREQIADNMKSLADKVENDQKLRQIFEKKSKLPIASFRNDIVSTIAKHQVVLLSGETGCGKTTQVPQLLLDYMWAKGQSCKIVCTQPRRISATSVAQRVAEERGEYIGESVGYKIRLESCGGRHSSIVFCTNGILLRVLVSGGIDGSQSRSNRISELTHIIVDEIHERDRNSDFIIAILRDLLPFYPHLRLVLMSATFDAERFSGYFGGCPIIRIPGFTHPVKSFYLDDVLPLLRSVGKNRAKATSSICPTEEVKLKEDYRATLDDAIEMACSTEDFDPLLGLIYADGSPEVVNYQHSSTGVSPLMLFAGKGRVSDVCTLLSLGADCQLKAFNGSTALDLAVREDQHEIAEIIKKHIESTTGTSTDGKLLEKYMSSIRPEFIDVNLIEKLLMKICSESMIGAILVFFPGWDDINKAKDRLLANPFFQDTSKFMILPLHSMVPSDEQKLVFKRPPLGCRKIVLSTNIAETSVTIDDVVYVIDSGRMKEKSYDPYNNVSTLQTSWISQASAKQREGRAGRCQPGVCYHLYSKSKAASLEPFQAPEIRRMPVEELCLQVKMLDPNCKIEEFLQKVLDPPLTETIKNGITILQDIGALSQDEQLTEFGSKLGYLPVHPLISRMLFFAVMLNCLDPALTLACVSDVKDPFVLPMSPIEREKAGAAKVELASLYGGSSDQLATIAAFDCWKKAKEKGVVHRFCSDYFISPSGMRLLDRTRKRLMGELISGGFIEGGDVSSCSMNARDPGIVRAILVAGLYPMVGKLKKSGNGKLCLLDTISCNRVRLHPQSVICKSSIKSSGDKQRLVVFDKVTRGDSGLLTRNCTAIAPLPLLLLATKIVVALENGHSDNGCGLDGDNNEMEIDKFSEQGGQIMSSPDNLVTVIVDDWLLFRSTALQIAQICCLRERLSSAILFKVTNPYRVLPPELGASIYAIACLFSFDGLSGISSIKLPSGVTPSRFLKSLVKPLPTREEISNESAQLRVLQAVEVGTVETVAKPIQASPIVAEGALGPPVTSSNVSSSMKQEPGNSPLTGGISKLSRKRKRKLNSRSEIQPIQVGPIVAEGAVGPPVTSSNVSSSMTQEPGKPSLAPVKSQSSRKKHKKQVNRSEDQPIQTSSVVTAGVVGPDGVPFEVSSSMTQEPGKPPLAQVKSNSSWESQPNQASPIVAEGVVGPPVTSSNVSSSMTQEPGKPSLDPAKSKSSRKKHKKQVNRSEGQPIQTSSIVTGVMGLNGTPLEVTSSIAQEPGKPPLTQVKSNSSCESQPNQASPIVAAGAVGPPGTSSEVISSVAQEPDKPSLAPVKSKLSRKKRKKQVYRSEGQPIQTSSVVTAGVVGPDGMPFEVSSSMTQEPGKPPLAQVKSNSSCESQPNQASPIVAEAVVGPPVTSSNVSSSMTQEPGKPSLAPAKSKSSRKKRKIQVNRSEGQPIQTGSIVTGVMGLNGTPLEVTSSATQEPGKPPLTQVKSNSSYESQPNQASPIVAAGAVGPPGTSSEVISSVAQEPGKPTLAPLKSKSSRKKRKKQVNSCSESQPTQASPIGMAGAGSMLVGPVAALSQAS